MKETLTAVIKHQWVKEHFLIIGEARQHLSVNITMVAKLPLLEPVEVTWAKKMVVPQNPEENIWTLDRLTIFSFGKKSQKGKKFLNCQQVLQMNDILTFQNANLIEL